MNTHHETNGVIINQDQITIRFGEMEPIVIPRPTLRTRLQLVEWIYRLTGWPGMTLHRMRMFIAAVFHHHGWILPDPADDSLLREKYRSAEINTSHRINS